MFKSLFTKFIGSRNKRLLKQLYKTVVAINELEPALLQLSDSELKSKTIEFRQRLDQGEALDDLLPEAFAVVREAAKRTLSMRHFDVQLIGGMVLHSGKIAEMRTGEGKTLVATLAVYLNALPGKGVHVVTVNDYLAQRDAEWMGKIYRFLGMEVGVVISGQSGEDKRSAYAADITYGTNNEYGFDYLRDNMAFRAEDRYQRSAHYAVIDEVDSILIDEARTPLIISGPAEESADLYRKINVIIPELTKQEVEDGPGDYAVDEKAKQAYLTDEGHELVEKLLAREGLLQAGSDLYDAANITLLHHINAALRAHSLYHREVDYIVKDNEVVIVDEFTGRMMTGRRWSDGLHQAVEAKENVKVQSENQTLASITFQNYFRLYDKLSGMTGTADTEAFEFQQTYGLEVIVIPTHLDMVRKDFGDQIYRTGKEKNDAILADIMDCNARKQPVLVGTISIDSSEHLSSFLKKEKIPHKILNAKHHEQEAQIIVEAGRPGAVTIATNMAGRGTDIVLGGNLEVELDAVEEDEKQREKVKADWQQRHDQVLAAGGLHVIGTERHESRRIDNQLRGRSGRQGDPGSTRFYLSLEDGLMRIFGSERVSNIMLKLGMQEGEAIEHPMVSRAIENAQRKVEGRNFDIRKQLLEYDDVANDQRKVIYEQRNRLMDAEDISDSVKVIREEVIDEIISQSIPPQSLEEQWNIEELEQHIEREFRLRLPIAQWLKDNDQLHEETLRRRIQEEFDKHYSDKEARYGSEIMREAEKVIMLQVVDREWKEHLSAMDFLRQGIHLRGYAQKNPKQEYKREAIELFSEMLSRIKHSVTQILVNLQIQTESELDALAKQRADDSNRQYQHPELNEGTTVEMDGDTATEVKPVVRQGRKIGRNEPCYCGSGKKFKRCHGKIE